MTPNALQVLKTRRGGYSESVMFSWVPATGGFMTLPLVIEDVKVNGPLIAS